MTKEEAQELIAEIKSQLNKENRPNWISSELEKIINRFANRIPKEGFGISCHFESDNAEVIRGSFNVTYNKSLHCAKFHLPIRCNEEEILLYVENLKILIDRCQQILDYMEPE